MLPVNIFYFFFIFSAWARPDLAIKDRQEKDCLNCHKREFDQWKSSHHALAERHISPKKINSYYSSRILGVAPLQQFLIEFPQGRLQVLDLAFDPKKNEWFNVFGAQSRQPGEWGHFTGRGMNWNAQCAGCHNTRVKKNYDVVKDAYNTQFSQLGVSCQACHNDHDKFSRDQILQTCASCHSRREDLTGNFRPGESFFNHFSLDMVDYTDNFYPDGQIREENYEFSSFLGSKMHDKGVNCIDCHDPHTAKLKLPGNLLCLQCHDGKNPNIPSIDPFAHSFHKIDPLYSIKNISALQQREGVSKMGGECINCHMPQTIYMQRHPRHDHGFTIPDPLLTVKFNIPNACNRCHVEKTASWALKWVEKRYGKKMEKPSRQRAEILSLAKAQNRNILKKIAEKVKDESSPYWRAAYINFLAPFDKDTIKDFIMDPSPLVREKVSQYFPHNSLKKDPYLSVRYQALWGDRNRLNYKEKSELLKIIDFKSDQPVGRMQRGTYFASLGNLSQAISNYKLAIKWDPFSSLIYHDLAILLAQNKQLSESIKYLKKACALEPKNADFKYKLGLAYYEMGEKNKALESFKQALKLDPNNRPAYEGLKLLMKESRKI